MTVSSLSAYRPLDHWISFFCIVILSRIQTLAIGLYHLYFRYHRSLGGILTYNLKKNFEFLRCCAIAYLFHLRGVKPLFFKTLFFVSPLYFFMLTFPSIIRALYFERNIWKIEMRVWKILSMIIKIIFSSRENIWKEILFEGLSIGWERFYCIYN